MDAGNSDFRDFCQHLELVRAWRLLGQKSDPEAAKVSQKLLQKMLYAAFQQAETEHFNYAFWLETLAAINDPATPRSTSRNRQLLDAEIEVRHKQLKSTSDWLALPPENWKIPQPLSLQRQPARQLEGESLSQKVVTLASQPEAVAERALLANWLSWRTTHRLTRSRFHLATDAAPILAPYTPRDRKRKARWVSAKLSREQQDEFQQAQKAAMSSSKRAVDYRAPQTKRETHTYEKKDLFTILFAFVVIVAVLPFFYSGGSNTSKDPFFKRNSSPWTNGQVLHPPERSGIPPRNPSPFRSAAAQLKFAALDSATQNTLSQLDRFKAWSLLAFRSESEVSNVEKLMFPGPRTQNAINAKRKSIKWSSLPDTDKESACYLSIRWLKETRLIWEDELAQTPFFPAGPVLKTIGSLEYPLAVAWSRNDPKAEELVDNLLFSDPLVRQQVAEYRAACRPPGYVSPENGQIGYREILEAMKKQVRDKYELEKGTQRLEIGERPPADDPAKADALKQSPGNNESGPRTERPRKEPPSFQPSQAVKPEELQFLPIHSDKSFLLLNPAQFDAFLKEELETLKNRRMKDAQRQRFGLPPLKPTDK